MERKVAKTPLASTRPSTRRSILPIADLRARMVMAGHSKAEIVSVLLER
jgi:hypothetical protein